ncbi:MAG: DUF3372 domain-containing protein, partial [Massilia sp.]
MSNSPRLARLIAAGTFALLSCAASASETPLSDCDGRFETVLHAGGARFDARAIWLDGTRLRWPGMQADGVFKLYHARQGGIIARAGAPVAGHDRVLDLQAQSASDPARFHWTGPGAEFTLAQADRNLHQGQLVLVRQDSAGRVLDATRIQAAGALDALFADAAKESALGVTITENQTRFKLWAPTAQAVAVCRFDSGSSNSRARAVTPMQRIEATGIWQAATAGDASGGYYVYLVDVLVDGVGLVRNRVTDPYSISLTTDSTRSYIGNLASPRLMPESWQGDRPPATVRALPDMSVYELHVRDFSINDPSVPAAHRGKYAAFSDAGSNGMRHLAALARAGLSDIHLLPIYDIGSVPERGCLTPRPTGGPASDAQQALVMRSADSDC